MMYQSVCLACSIFFSAASVQAQGNITRAIAASDARPIALTRPPFAAGYAPSTFNAPSVYKGNEDLEEEEMDEYPPLDIEGPMIYAEEESRILEDLGVFDFENPINLYEEAIDDPGCPKDEVLAVKNELETFLNELRGRLRDRFIAVIGTAIDNNQVPTKSELMLLKAELDALRELYAQWYQALWTGAVDEGTLNVRVAGNALKCMPNTLTWVHQWFSEYYLTLAAYDPSLFGEDIAKAQLKENGGAMPERRDPPHIAFFPFIPFVPVPGAPFIQTFQDHIMISRLSDRASLTELQGLRSTLNGFNDPEFTPTHQQARRRLSGLLTRTEVRPSSSQRQALRAALELVVAFRSSPTDPFRNVVVFNQDGWALFLASRAPRDWGWRRRLLAGAFMAGAGTNSMTIGNITYTVVSAPASIDAQGAAQARYRSLQRILINVGRFDGLDLGPEEALLRRLDELFETRPRLRPRAARPVGALLTERYVLAELYGLNTFVEATPWLTYETQLRPIYDAGLQVARRELGAQFDTTLETPASRTQGYARVNAALAALENFRRAGIPSNVVGEILAYTSDLEMFNDVWGGRTPPDLRNLARFRNTHPSNWAAYRTRAQLDEAIGAARQAATRTIRQFVGLTVAQTSALTLLELFGRGGFTREYFQQHFPGITWTASNVARAIGIPEEFFIFPAGVGYCILRDTSVATVLMTIDKLFTRQVARALAARGAASWAAHFRNHGLARFIGPPLAAYYAWHTFSDLPNLAQATSFEVGARLGLSMVHGALAGGQLGSFAGAPGIGIGATVGAAGAGIITIVRANQLVDQIRADGVVATERQNITTTMQWQSQVGFIRGTPRTTALTVVERDYFNDRRLSLFHGLLVERAAIQTFRDGGMEAIRNVESVIADSRIFSMPEMLVQAVRLVFGPDIVAPTDRQARIGMILEAERQANEYHAQLLSNYRHAFRYTPRAVGGGSEMLELAVIDRDFPFGGTISQQEAYLARELPYLFSVIVYREGGVNLLSRFAPRIYSSLLVQGAIAQADQIQNAANAFSSAVTEVLAHIQRSDNTILYAGIEGQRTAQRHLAGWQLFTQHLISMTAEGYRENTDFAFNTLAAIYSPREPDPWHSVLIDPNSRRSFVPASDAYRRMSVEQRLVATMVGNPNIDRGSNLGLQELPIGWLYLGVIDGYAVSATPARNGVYLRRQRGGRMEIAHVPALPELISRINRIAIPAGAVGGPSGAVSEFDWRAQRPELHTFGSAMLSQMGANHWEEIETYFRDRRRLNELSELQERSLLGSVRHILAQEVMVPILPNGEDPEALIESLALEWERSWTGLGSSGAAHLTWDNFLMLLRQGIEQTVGPLNGFRIAQIRIRIEQFRATGS